MGLTQTTSPKGSAGTGSELWTGDLGIVARRGGGQEDKKASGWVIHLMPE